MNNETYWGIMAIMCFVYGFGLGVLLNDHLRDRAERKKPPAPEEG